MLNYKDLKPDQLTAIDYAFEHDVTYMVATMGTGKSIITLTAVDDLLEDETLTRVLIVAPLKVCNDVWRTEHEKWGHTTHMDIEYALGSTAKRKAAIESGAEIVVINIDNLVWFLNEYPAHNFDGIVIDEISKFKDNGTKLVKKLRKAIKRFKWVLAMTGTPVAESFTGLYAQMLCIDGGATFGKNHEKFLREYFYPVDFDEHDWQLKDGSEELIINKMADCLHVVPSYTHELPALHEMVIGFDMSVVAFDWYKKFARDAVTEIDGVEIVADNAAVLSGKLNQFASGFLYTDEGTAPKVTYIERVAKLNTLMRSVPRAIITYWYKAELESIRELFDCKGVNYITMDHPDAIGIWNRREVDYLLLQPASASHGINLAAGGCDMIFFAPIWSNDQTKQVIARIWRRGQTEPCTVYTLCCNKTIDMLKLQKIEDKEEFDILFNAHIANLEG